MGGVLWAKKIVASVQAIENQAQQIKEDFQKKIDEAKIQANQKISESKKNVDIALSNYEKELEDKYSQKKLDFQEELASLQKRRNSTNTAGIWSQSTRIGSGNN